MKHSTCENKHKKRPYYKSEGEFHKLVLEHRKKGRNISKLFIKTKTKLCVLHHYPEKDNAFKASNGWFIYFANAAAFIFASEKVGRNTVEKIT